MIVPMKQLTLLCLEAEKEPALLTLRDLGVVHLLPTHPPESEELDAARKQVVACRKILTALESPAAKST